MAPNNEKSNSGEGEKKIRSDANKDNNLSNDKGSASASKPKLTGSSTSTPASSKHPFEGMRLPGIVEIGPVTTVGAVMNARPSDDVMGDTTGKKDVLVSPTMGELHKFLSGKMEGGKGKEEGGRHGKDEKAEEGKGDQGDGKGA